MPLAERSVALAAIEGAMGALNDADRGEVVRVFGTLYSADLAKQSRLRLTKRDSQLLHYYADGASDQEIADALHLHVGSVGTLGTRLRKRIGARSRAHAVAIALRMKAML